MLRRVLNRTLEGLLHGLTVIVLLAFNILGKVIGYKLVFKFLVKLGMDFNMQNNNGVAFLHIAARYKNKEKIEALVSNGADVNIQGAYGKTPLHIAASYKNKETIEALISNGADVNKPDNKGKTPLHIAARWWCTEIGYKEMIEALINKGADVNKPDNNGETPLHIVARWGRDWRDKKVIETLISDGADVYKKNKDGNTPLHVGNSETKQCIEDYVKIRDIKRKLITKRLMCNSSPAVEEIFNNVHSVSDLNNYIKACIYIRQDGDDTIKILDKMIMGKLYLCLNEKQLLDELEKAVRGRPSSLLSRVEVAEYRQKTEYENNLQIGC